MKLNKFIDSSHSLAHKIHFNLTQKIFLVFVASIPFEYRLLTDMGTLTKIIGLIVLLGFLIRFSWTKKRRIILPQGSGIFMLLLAWSFLSLLWAENFDNGFKLWLRLMLSLIIWILGYNLFKNGNQVYWVISVFYISTVATAIIAPIQDVELHNRLTFAQEQPNNLFANTLAFAFLCGLLLILNLKNKKLRIAIYACNLMLLYSLMNTGSRGSILGLIAGVSVYLFRRSNQRKTILIVSIITLLVLYFLPAQIYENIFLLTSRSRLTFSIAEHMTRNLRSDIISIGINESLKALPLGLGLGQIEYVLSSQLHFGGEILNPHNILLRWAADTGIIGIFLFLLMYFKITMKLYRSLAIKFSTEALAGLGFLSLMFVHGLFTELLFHKPFWLAIMIATIFLNMNQKEKLIKQADQPQITK